LVTIPFQIPTKGITGFDYEKGFWQQNQRGELGLKAQKNGFISIDDDHESVSKT
jgi:hypothetical protein